MVHRALNACLSTEEYERTLHPFSVAPQSISEHRLELPNCMGTLAMLSA